MMYDLVHELKDFFVGYLMSIFRIDNEKIIDFAKEYMSKIDADVKHHIGMIDVKIYIIGLGNKEDMFADVLRRFSSCKNRFCEIKKKCIFEDSDCSTNDIIIMLKNLFGEVSCAKKDFRKVVAYYNNLIMLNNSCFNAENMSLYFYLKKYNNFFPDFIPTRCIAYDLVKKNNNNRRIDNSLNKVYKKDRIR